MFATRYQPDNACLKSLSQYDEYNIPFETFTRACQRARDIILANTERTATRLVTNKLRRPALSAVESFDVQIIGKLCDLLRKVFGRHRTFQQYRAKLSTTYMGRNEHILDYIDRVKGLHRILCDEECQGLPEIIENKLAEINEIALTSFYVNRSPN
ncbi:hypothetical protein V1478_002746 [Vespula squamosa]|uniref:Uncharacterized protein n=1 Tax=Vespula squamosa TaxID=30214 RepID=A0ABD2BSH8_VESSQ